MSAALRAPVDEAHVVEFDRFDRAAHRSVAEPAGLSALGAQGARLMPTWPTLVEDLFYAFYKGDARLRAPDALPASALVGRRLIDEVMRSRGFAESRRRTLLDPAAAAAATRSVGARLLGLIRHDRLLLDEEVIDAHRTQAAEQALAEVEAAREALEQMGDEAALDPGDPGPGRVAQRVMEIELDAEIELRQEGLESARARARQAAESIPRDLLGRIRTAVDAVPGQLVALEADLEQFGRSMGVGASVDGAQRVALGQTLARSEKLRKLAALVGAFRQQARVQRTRRTARRGPEVYRIERGADPARLLAGELSALRHPTLRRDVRRRFVEGQLLQYGLRGPDDRGRGPMVICLDGSGSMRGAKELWAKAVTLTLVEQARRQKRACRAIIFSAPPQPLFVRDLVSGRTGADGRRLAAVRSMVEFAEHFPAGGTAFEPPLEHALETLDESRFRRGDIVFVTDGESRVSPAFAQRFTEARQRLGCRMIGVLVDVGHVRAEVLSALADEVQRVRELTGGAAMKVLESVR